MRTARMGRELTQREFVLGLIEAALNEAKRQVGIGPCETTETESGSQERGTPLAGL